ncbi:MAG: ABC transporter permease [Pseudomonadota bacterium]
MAPSRTFTAFRKNKLALTGLAILAAMVVVALAAPYIAGHDPAEINVKERLKPPAAGRLMGTDDFGRDVFSRVVYGTRVSLIIALCVSLTAAALGAGLGMISGYWGGPMDFVTMRFMDGLMAFPALLLSLAIMAALGPSTLNLIIALAVVYVPTFARLTRSSVLVIRELEYVEAAKAAGADATRIIFDHILPNCLSPLIIQVTVVFGYAILSEAALSFLGFGAPSKASWGTILSEGRKFVYDAPWISVYPGLAISLFVLGVNLAGDGLRDVLDPRMK